MTTWEYLIVSLPMFEPPKAVRGQSASVEILNHEGGNGWEAVSWTMLPDGTAAVLMKRRIEPDRM